MRTFFFVLSLVSLSVSCSKNNSEGESLIVLPLAQSINVVKSRLDGTNIIKQHRVIPLETSDSVLVGVGRIHNVTDDHIILTDNNTVYVFAMTDGHLINKFNREGNGPGEYLSIKSLAYNFVDSTIYIYDYNKKNMNVYSSKGKSLAQFNNDSIGDFTIDREGQFIATYRPFQKWHHLIGVYNSEWKAQASFIDNPPLGDRIVNLWPTYSIYEFNGKPYVNLSDTLYRISTEIITPVIVLDKASLTPPEDVLLNIRRKNERNKYIWGDYGYWAGDYYFLYYVYNNAAYYDLWKTSTRDLLYRNIRISQEKKEGIPINLNGKIVYLWPSYVKDNKIYCLLIFDMASAVYPPYNENDNPVILEIELKH